MRFKTFLAELSGRIVDGNDVDADNTFTNLTNRLAGKANRPSVDGDLSGDDATSKIIQLIATKRHLQMSDPDLRALLDPLTAQDRQKVAARLKQTHTYLDSEYKRLEKFIDTLKKDDGSPLFPHQKGTAKPSSWLPNTGNDDVINAIYASWSQFSGAQLAAKIKDLETHYTDKVAELIQADDKQVGPNRPSKRHALAAGAFHYLSELREVTNAVIQELLKAPKQPQPVAPATK